MPLVWKRGSPQEFVNLGKRIEDQLYPALAAAMTGVVMQAAANARANTDRVDTGAMIEAIDMHEVEVRAGEIIGKFGFLGQRADYFLYQTVTGFTHWLSGQFIEPTFALRDARVVAENELVDAIQAAIRSVRL